MELQLPHLLERFYPCLDELVKAFNIFASLHGYAIVKKHTKVSKKEVLLKAVLMGNRGKEPVDKNESKRDTTSKKTNCLFITIAILEEEGWRYRLCNSNHNYYPV